MLFIWLSAKNKLILPTKFETSSMACGSLEISTFSSNEDITHFGGLKLD